MGSGAEAVALGGVLRRKTARMELPTKGEPGKPGSAGSVEMTEPITSGQKPVN